jgi:hypothetical protein
MLQQLFLDMALGFVSSVSSPQVQTFIMIYTTASVGLRLVSDVQSSAALVRTAVRRARELRAHAVPVLGAPATVPVLAAHPVLPVLRAHSPVSDDEDVIVPVKHKKSDHSGAQNDRTKRGRR